MLYSKYVSLLIARLNFLVFCFKILIIQQSKVIMIFRQAKSVKYVFTIANITQKSTFVFIMFML